MKTHMICSCSECPIWQFTRN